VWLSLAVLALAWFAVINLAAGAIAWLWARVLVRRERPPAADLLALVRLMPAALPALFVLVVFVPSHLRLEPAHSDESFGVVLIALTLTSVLMLLRSSVRLLGVARVARRARRALAAHASTVTAGGRMNAAYELEQFAGLSLAGVFKPRILVGSPVRRALTPPELELAIAHERAHLASRDNLKRCAMFCAPDLFGFSSTARALEERWRGETECKADAHAVAGDERRAVLLASALVKAARVAGQGGPLASPVWSAFHEPALLETRVRRLVSGAALILPPRRATLSVVLALTAAVALVGSSVGAEQIYHASEALVRLLP
jgi:beta-lactamase regulating signal transducer with metallopeptidase domain